MARMVIEEVTDSNTLCRGGKKGVTEIMRNPETYLENDNVIKSKLRASEEKVTSSSFHFAEQVRDAIDTDPLYGTRHDNDRRMIGIEYEVVLEYNLKQYGEQPTIDWRIIFLKR